jgi:hypothetical protein
MEQKKFEKILNKLYPGFTITDYMVLPRNQLNKKNEWVPDSPAIFICVNYNSDDNNISIGQISEELTGLTGFEVNLNRY